MQSALPPESGSSEDAASGTRIHAVLAGEAGESTLSPAELETMDMCAAQMKTLVCNFFGVDNVSGL